MFDPFFQGPHSLIFGRGEVTTQDGGLNYCLRMLVDKPKKNCWGRSCKNMENADKQIFVEGWFDNQQLVLDCEYFCCTSHLPQFLRRDVNLHQKKYSQKNSSDHDFEPVKNIVSCSNLDTRIRKNSGSNGKDKWIVQAPFVSR